MGIHHEGPLSDLLGAVVGFLGIASQLFIGRRIHLPKWLNYGLAACLGIVFFLIDEHLVPQGYEGHTFRGVASSCIFMLYVVCIAVALLLFLRDLLLRRTEVKAEEKESPRREFLKVSTAAVCAAPAVVFGFGVITRKNFHVNEVDLKFPNLPKDLQNLRVLHISDMHVSAFFSLKDLVRVVDASNELRPDIAFITGDMITEKYDPLDSCLQELSKLRAWSGRWGCMGNHELYSGVQDYAAKKARSLDMFFLRQQAQMLRFGNSRLNLVGIDFQRHKPFLPDVDHLISPGDFNLLLAHTPEVFPAAANKNFDLVLSGHTHGGQINLELMGQNFNVVDIRTPYTKGEYHLQNSTIYVNSGLGTIGVPARIGAPPEITLIRLCNS